MSAVGSPLAVILDPEGTTVDPVVDALLQHKRTVFVMFVNGSVGTVNDVV